MTLFKYLFSPFKFPKISFYLGKIAIGTPYFLPRKWINIPNGGGYKAVPIKWWGLQFISLGYKTKWSSTDYRFEWSPMFSLVFLGIQFCVTINPDYKDHYWESWLYYQYSTDKNKSRKERVRDCRKEFSQTWTRYKEGETISIDYYEKILRKKYLPIKKEQ